MTTKDFTSSAEGNMKKTVEYLAEKLAHIRAGKANPKLLDGIMVSNYGMMMPLNQVATITSPDSRTLAITPWDKKSIKDIEKAIMDSPLGITPENNGEIIRLSLPPLTEERRKQLVKQVKAEVEEAKISIRNARREAIDAAKKSVKNDGTPEDVAKATENEVQKIHDKFVDEVDKLFAAKEQEILTV